MRACHKQSLHEKVSHVHAHEHTAITAAILLGRVIQVHEPDWHVEEVSEFAGHDISFPDIALVQRVIVESDAVDDRDQQKGPMGTAFCLADVAAIIDGEENVGGSAEVWECFAKSAGIWGL